MPHMMWLYDEYQEMFNRDRDNDRFFSRGGFRGGSHRPSRGDFRGGLPSRGDFRGGLPSRGDFRGGYIGEFERPSRGGIERPRNGDDSPNRFGDH